MERKLRPTPQQEAPQLPAEQPVKQEGQPVHVTKIHLLGCETFPPETFSSLVSKYENRDVTLTELQILTKKIEQEYLTRGVISAVFVPPQEVKDGAVTIQVVEARMGELQIVQDHLYFNKERLRYYWQIPKGEVLRYDKLSRILQFMSRNPDREVKAALHAGTTPGSTDVALSSVTQFPIHGTFSVDNEGTIPTGKTRVTFGGRHNNFLGLDDMLMTGYMFGKDFTVPYFYHSVPITPFGTTILYGASLSKSVPRKDFSQFDLRSRMESESFSIHQDIYEKDVYRGEIYAGFDAKDKTITTNTGVLNRDRLRSINVGNIYVRKLFGGGASIKTEFVQGMGAFGASPYNNPLSSRGGGAHSTYSKLTLDIQNKVALPWELQENLRLRMQYSSTKLTPQEEFGMGGIDTVRGYPPTDYLADQVVLANTEILIPSFFIPEEISLPYAEAPLKQQLTSVIFFDYGAGMRRGDSKAHYMAGVGAGIRLTLYNQMLIRLEWAAPVADKPITESSPGRFHFSLDMQEKLPEEIERITKAKEEDDIKKLAWRIIDDELARPESPLRTSIGECVYRARAYYAQGDLKKAQEYYVQLYNSTRSLYYQAEEYLRSLVTQRDQLLKYRKQARIDSLHGNLAAARTLYEKIVAEAKPKPFIVEF